MTDQQTPDEIRAERDQLARWKAEALPVLAGLHELGRALGIPPGVQITGDTAKIMAAQLNAVAHANRRARVAAEAAVDAFSPRAARSLQEGAHWIRLPRRAALDLMQAIDVARTERAHG